MSYRVVDSRTGKTIMRGVSASVAYDIATDLRASGYVVDIEED